MKKIAILGSTGSIGTQTLDVVREHSDELQVVALAAGSNKERLKEQIKEFHPKLVSLSDEKKAQELKEELAGEQVEVVCGMEGLIEVAGADSADVVVTAVVGMMGILPTMEAIKKGKDIALANKETLVTAGHLIIPMAKEYGVSILPVDSEHSAIFQSLQGEPIEYALFYPERRSLSGDRLDFSKLSQITFEKPDYKVFRGLSLAIEAGKTGGTMPTVFNAANERAVAKFLKGEIKYTDIVRSIEKCMDAHKVSAHPDLEEILATEQWVYSILQ